MTSAEMSSAGSMMKVRPGVTRRINWMFRSRATSSTTGPRSASRAVKPVVCFSLNARCWSSSQRWRSVFLRSMSRVRSARASAESSCDCARLFRSRSSCSRVCRPRRISSCSVCSSVNIACPRADSWATRSMSMTATRVGSAFWAASVEGAASNNPRRAAPEEPPRRRRATRFMTLVNSLRLCSGTLPGLSVQPENAAVTRRGRRKIV